MLKNTTLSLLSFAQIKTASAEYFGYYEDHNKTELTLQLGWLVNGAGTGKWVIFEASLSGSYEKTKTEKCTCCKNVGSGFCSKEYALYTDVMNSY